MENQPTVILLLFTDYLNNRDSIALFRLSRSFWLSHRSPQGRYRLKCLEYGRFPRPSKIPPSYLDFPLSCPSAGHFLLDFLFLSDVSDVSLFCPLEGENSHKIFHSVHGVSILINQIDEMFKGLRKLPDTVDRVFFEESSEENEPIMKSFNDFLPAGIKTLDFSESKQGVKGIQFSCFPQLETLGLWETFDGRLRENFFPPGLKILEFHRSFNQGIGEFLPESLEELYLGKHFSSFNQPLPEKLPRNLKHLDLGFSFNFPIHPGQLPIGLRILKLSSEFNSPLALDSFPEGLEEIYFFSFPYCVSYEHPYLPGIFPNSLKILSLDLKHGDFSHPLLPGLIPSSLESLYIDLPIGYSHPLPSLSSSSFPHLRKLILSSTFQPRVFPSTLEEINDFNQTPLEGIFPVGLKKIKLGTAYNQPLPLKIFPQKVHTIELSNWYSHPLEVGLFPSSVRKLKISTKHPLPMGIFPEGLESIEFCPTFSQPLLPGIFPSSLRRLTFMESHDGESSFHEDFLPGVLPEFLCELLLPREYRGLFPSSALPPYFQPDFPLSSSSSSVPHILNSPENPEENHRFEHFLSHLGRSDREFFLKILRTPVSYRESYILAEPLDGLSDGFLIPESFTTKIPYFYSGL